MGYQVVLLKALYKIALLLCFWSVSVFAQDESVCAVVKIEIKQELTLERQAFDAEMRITNGLDDIPLNDVNVDVYFEDDSGNVVLASSDPNSSEASFYIRIASLDNLDNVDGTGVIAAGATAVANWLIIPAQGAAKDVSGSVYYVGATLTYTVNGEEESIAVAPDRIVVNPLPRLTLDYFLEEEVIADDAFTPEIEPAIPFTLGVRVSNNGQAIAPDVKIDSAQPEIIENEQGLAIGFEIIGSYISDQPVTPSLLIDFGDVPAQEARMGRWQMVTSVSGEFTDFTASFTHADDLGGELTSLLDATNTHLLIKDVLVDLNGRDAVLDFLADDGDQLRVYESNTVDTVVQDQSASASMAFVQNTGEYQQYSVSLSPTAGFVFARIPDSFNFNGNKVVHEVFRSDGKRIALSNVWFSQSRNESQGFDHFINVFDVDTNGEYTVVLADKADVPQAPVLQFIPDRSVAEGAQLSFLVEASDPNGTVPVVSLDSLPEGVMFSLDNTDNNVATYIFDWTPAGGQAGRYELNFIASDGELSSNRRANVDVLSGNDSDNDGMDDDWELEHFGTLDRDGTGDFDGDGISDLDEFLLGSDPRTGLGSGPSVPVIDSPLFGDQVDTLLPTLTIENSTVEPIIPLQYVFEVYTDAALTALLLSETVDEQLGLTTSYSLTQNVQENTHYYWRARAYDGMLYSEWVNGEFFVNSVAEAPGDFTVSSPADGGDVATLTPILVVNNAADPDGDALTYVFEVFEDIAMSVEVVSSPPLAAGASGSTQWQVNDVLEDEVIFYWQVTATDASGLSSVTPPATFFVNLENDPPSGLSVLSPEDGAEVDSIDVVLHVNPASDPDNASLLYEFELDTVNTFDGPERQSSGLVSALSFEVSELEEDALYYWRARASDGFAQSEWVQASFRVNATNLAPPMPTVANPGDGAWVATVLPTLSVNPIADPDGDDINYQFEIYSDEALMVLVDTEVSATESWLLTSPLEDNRWYYWRVQVQDEYGLNSDWSATSSFFANDNDIDDAPNFVFLLPVENFTVDESPVTITWSDDDPDSAATISVYYETNNDGVDGTLIVGDISEDADGESDSVLWDTSGLAGGEYYLYAVIADASNAVTVQSPAVITIPSTNNEAPTISITSPASDIALVSGEETLLRWIDNDDDDSALVSLYYDTDNAGADGTLIVENLAEDLDDFGDFFEWNTSGAPVGEIYVYAVIDDGVNAPVVSYAEGVITLSLASQTGTEESDELTGGSASETLDGGAGDDTLSGFGGDDVLVGGADNDLLIGGWGDDTYVIGLNDGNDIIDNFEYTDGIRNDRIQFSDGITPADVRASLDNTDLLLTIVSTGQVVRVLSHFYHEEGRYDYRINSVVFEDGTILNDDDLRALILAGSDADDVIYGFSDSDDVIDGGLGDDELHGVYGNDTLIGGPDADRLFGNAGDDQLLGGTGDDHLEGGSGNDVMDGGDGNDTLVGWQGNDVYVIGLDQGNDTIENYNFRGSENPDGVIRFGSGIVPSDVVPSSVDLSLVLTVISTGQTVIVGQHFYMSENGIYYHAIGSVEFADGTTWSRETIRNLVLATTDGDDVVYGFSNFDDVIDGGYGRDQLYGAYGNDTLIGGPGDDSLFGEADDDTLLGGENNDSLDGGSGADTLNGGPGDDTMLGGSGADRYVIALNDGNDVINNFDFEAANDARLDRVVFAEGVEVSDVALSSLDYALVITVVSTGQTITVDLHFYSWDGLNSAQLGFIEFADGTEWNAAEILTRSGYTP